MATRRDTPRADTTQPLKLKQFAGRLGAAILRPYYPVSDLFRVVRDDGLQVDLMGTIHGIRSFEGVRARATMVTVDGAVIAVASLDDIIRSKRAAGRPHDLAVVMVLERTDARRKAAKTTATPPRGTRRTPPRKRPRTR